MPGPRGSGPRGCLVLGAGLVLGGAWSQGGLVLGGAWSRGVPGPGGGGVVCSHGVHSSRGSALAESAHLALHLGGGGGVCLWGGLHPGVGVCLQGGGVCIWGWADPPIRKEGGTHPSGMLS